jgi:hypothetical protein
MPRKRIEGNRNQENVKKIERFERIEAKKETGDYRIKIKHMTEAFAFISVSLMVSQAAPSG